MDSSSSNQEDTVSANFSHKVLMSPPPTVSPSVEEKGPQQGKEKKTPNFPEPCCFNTVEVLILLFQSAAFFNLLILRVCQWSIALSSKQLNKPLSQ